MKGVLVLSTPLDGDFADSIKGALSADVLIGGPSGNLEVTFRTRLGRRSQPLELAPGERAAVLQRARISEGVEVEGARYELAATALLDRKDHPIGVIGVAVDREPLAATKRLALRSLVAGGLVARRVRDDPRTRMVAAARRAHRAAAPRCDRGVARRSRSSTRHPRQRRAHRPRDGVQPDDVDAQGQPGTPRRTHARDRRAPRRRSRGVVGHRSRSGVAQDRRRRRAHVRRPARRAVAGRRRQAAGVGGACPSHRRVELAGDRRGARRGGGAARRSPKTSTPRSDRCGSTARQTTLVTARPHVPPALRARSSLCRSIARRASSACSPWRAPRTLANSPMPTSIC